MTPKQKVLIAVCVAVGFTLGLIGTLITKQAGVIAVAGGVVAVIARIFMVRGQRKQQEKNPDQSQ